jgi:hypothetical protein
MEPVLPIQWPHRPEALLRLADALEGIERGGADIVPLVRPL